jgi:hypothetical protein
VSGTDTLAIIAAEPGDRKLMLGLTDKAGFRDAASLAYRVHPKLGSLFRLKRYDSACPAYAQEPVLMRLAVAMSHFTHEQTKADGIGTADFALKLARALTGTGFPLGLLDGFEYGFSEGRYRFKAGAFTLDAAFHYGPGMAGHAEGDTIRSNLFALRSYISGSSFTVLPPSFKYTKGPLAELIDGNIAVDIDDPENPEFDFKVDFNRIRFSFSRESRTLLVLSNAEITLANALLFTLYEGKAKIAPVYPGDVIRLYGQDSLELDFSGTKASSPELPLAWAYEAGGIKDTAVYKLSLVQETVRQKYRFGEADGVKKVFGTYAAVNRLGENGDLQALYFSGGYSSTAPDSARFFCAEPMEEKDFFGTAAFETERQGRGRFQAQRYEYEFTFPYSTVEPWKGGLDGLPGLPGLPKRLQ